jgi:hypothetical protein
MLRLALSEHNSMRATQGLARTSARGQQTLRLNHCKNKHSTVLALQSAMLTTLFSCRYALQCRTVTVTAMSMCFA